ncbi:MAG: coproporphyrinogen dehydrogenase HemZ [Oscillospiraceae bacterium]|nr:coproporphyrinogen dehydrogenase HemZ [Oscillospiraceae bacterium]
MTIKAARYPPWGTLTGIRPAKVAEKLLVKGNSEQTVIETLIKKYHVTSDRAALCVETAQAAIRCRSTLAPKDVALYVGIPFCPTRCAYCSFVSNSVERSNNLIEPFVETLLQEIKSIAQQTKELGLRIISVYIGGGTPTSLPEEALELIMSALLQEFDFSGLREYTVEAGRPDTITAKNLEIMTRLGAKRICINPQSMSPEVLTAIGRKHSSEDVFKAARLVRRTDASLNMDIIAGLPCDTLDGFKKTLDSVIEFSPENITVHTLSLKKGSRIMLENTIIPSGANVGEMLGYASHQLRESKYAPYYIYRQKYISGGFENTGWSKPGYEGIYNSCMMDELCTVLAVGGGGVTKLVTSDGRIERVFNAKYPLEYINMTEKMKEKTGRVREYAISI